MGQKKNGLNSKATNVYDRRNNQRSRGMEIDPVESACFEAQVKQKKGKADILSKGSNNSLNLNKRAREDASNGETIQKEKRIRENNDKQVQWTQIGSVNEDLVENLFEVHTIEHRESAEAAGQPRRKP